MSAQLSGKLLSTVAELKEAIKDLPDDMQVATVMSSGIIIPIGLSIARRGKSNKNYTVTRGGVEILCIR